MTTRRLGPFELGQAPLLRATIDPLTAEAVSTACKWTIRTPGREVIEVTSPDDAITNPDPNVWTYQMPAIEEDGAYWVRCQSTEGVIGSKTMQLGVIENIFDEED